MKNHNNIRTKICFIDFETTGSNLFEDEPIQIGALLCDEKLNELKKFNSYIKPMKNTKSSSKAYEIHHIDVSRMKDEPTPNKVLRSFFKSFGTDYCFAGWNISFDVPFFKKMCYEHGYQNELDRIHYRHVDVQSIFKYLKYLNVINKDLNSLSDYSKYFGIKRSKNHDALEDARITYLLFKRALDILEMNK